MKLMRKISPSETQPEKNGRIERRKQDPPESHGFLHRAIIGIPTAAVDRVVQWKSVFCLSVLFGLLGGVTFFYVSYGTEARQYITENQLFALPEYSVQIAYFSILGVIAQKLSTLEQDAKDSEKDLIIYTADVLSASVYAPLVCVSIIFTMSVLHIEWGETDLSIGSSQPGFISIVSLVLGFQHGRLRSMLNKAYRKIFERQPAQFECPYRPDEDSEHSKD